MNDMRFDFSGASKVRESLKASLMRRYAAKRGGRERVDDSMLDEVVAAGNPNVSLGVKKFSPEQK